MHSPSLQNRRLSRAVFALAALLLMPSLAQAQNRAAAKPLQSYDETHKSVIVTVDYVDVSLTDLMKTSQWIASGQRYDALLLAALVKGGAQDTKGTEVQSWDGGLAERRAIVSVTAPNGQPLPQYLMSYIKASPKFNADGTVAVSLELQLDSVGPKPLFLPAFGRRPAQTLFYEGMTNLSHDDAKLILKDSETIKIGQRISRSATGAYIAHLTFVQVTPAAGQKIALKPGIALPITLIAPAKPRSVDPAMVTKPTNPKDQNMVIGLGTQPERLDHMNILPPATK